ncbi:hypothetical protein H8959_001483 [Pygathrix nigripes]
MGTHDRQEDFPSETTMLKTLKVQTLPHGLPRASGPYQQICIQSDILSSNHTELLSRNPFEISERTVRLPSLQGAGESKPSWIKTTWCGTRIFSAHRGGPAPVGSGQEPGREFGGAAGAASARPPARSGGVEVRAAQPALQRELSAALGSLCSQPLQRRLRHSAETETSGGDARTGSDRRAAKQLGRHAGRQGRFRGRGGLEEGQPETRRPGPDTHTAPGAG